MITVCDPAKNFLHGDVVVISSEHYNQYYLGALGLVDKSMMLGEFVNVVVETERGRLEYVGFHPDELEVLDNVLGRRGV
jgi:hypothetical protein